MEDQELSGNISDKIRAIASDYFEDKFKTPENETFVTIKLPSGGLVNYSTNSKNFKDFLVYKYYEKYKKAPPLKQLNEAIASINAQVMFESKTADVFHRVHLQNNEIFLDLHNEYGDWVHITSSGWELNRTTPPKIKFNRTPNSLAINTPNEVSKDKVFLLKNYLNLKEEEDFLLILAFICSLFNTDAPQLILIFQGEQGCGKTSNTKVIRRLIDPNNASIRAFTNKEEDLLIAAKNSFLLAYDNLSGISNRMADALCRLSTGSGFGKRKLYSDFEEAIVSIKRPIILNGIDDLSSRADMVDRSLILDLPKIPSHIRKTESEIWENFERDCPEILGALMSLVSEVLGVLSSIQLKDSPRMKDFAKWGTALGLVLGYPETHFLEVYRRSILGVNLSTIDTNPLLSFLLRELISNEDDSFSSSYEATSEWILERLSKEHHPKYSSMPKSPQGVGRMLRRLTPVLNTFGVEVDHIRRDRGERLNRFTRSNPEKSLLEQLYGIKKNKHK